MNEKKIKLILKAFQLNGNDFKLETPSFVIINDHNLFVVSFYNNNDDDDKILIYKNKTKGKNKKIKVDKKLDVDKLMKEIKKVIDSKSQKKHSINV